MEAMMTLADLALIMFNGMSWAAATFLVAAGLTLIFGILHILNFAHGGFFMIGAYIAFTLMQLLGGGAVPLWLYMVVALASGMAVAALGVAADFAIFRRLRDVEDAYVLIATYALLLVCDGAVKLIWGLNFMSVPTPAELGGALFLGDMIMPEFAIFVIVCGILTFIGLDLLMERTSFGKLIRAVAMDSWMATLLGINVGRVLMVTVVIAFGLAGLAGGLLAANQSLSPSLAGVFLLQAFGVIIVGGMGSIRGAAIAAVMLGMIESFGTVFVPDYPGIFFFIALAAVLLIRPQGLMGKAQVA
ncbi:branched-chain amino acid ABC transporter permease (plasmid) [Tistrella bauzanensis]|uniref:Branched-chain amino acid ABC transporter permease n=1 Tax=Tistrella bauzanensis TaxID=657419 RepID=A0ABQ1IJV0_9PROT|nr:branched-chain amino acid ABC transporter permease [Tistrella bauzanensis]GGB44471.1 branched-chain amino acid ABC transporter permease [Tistrella bauzanensis]